MMGKHLPKVLSPLLDIQDKHLLNPECHLNKIIRLEESVILDLWIPGPNLSCIPPIWAVADNIKAPQEGNTVVKDTPGLFCEAGCAASCRVRSETIEKRLENVSHENCTEQSETQHPRKHKRPVALTLVVQLRGRIEVRESKEFRGIRLIKEQMGCRQRSQHRQWHS